MTLCQHDSSSFTKFVTINKCSLMLQNACMFFQKMPKQILKSKTQIVKQNKLFPVMNKSTVLYF